jgi:hypothetical protein
MTQSSWYRERRERTDNIQERGQVEISKIFYISAKYMHRPHADVALSNPSEHVAELAFQPGSCAAAAAAAAAIVNSSQPH